MQGCGQPGIPNDPNHIIFRFALLALTRDCILVSVCMYGDQMLQDTLL